MGIAAEDLIKLVGVDVLDKLADDDRDGRRDDAVVESYCQQADDFAASYLLKGFTREQIGILIEEDQSLRAQVGWVALEMLSERKPEFLNAEGKGRYWAQYERAADYFERLAKAKGHSVGEAKGGASAQRGGAVNPPVPAAAPTFTFATSKNNPYGSGGF